MKSKIELNGKFGDAVVYTSEIEEGARHQIVQLLNQDFIGGCKIRIMPDVHEGMGCVIGFTADMKDIVIPNIVGVDIGCGMLCVNLGKLDIDFQKLDRLIQEEIPSGFNIHEQVRHKFDRLEDLHCYRDLKNTKRIERSMGSLGGGNHFIELGKDREENVYLIIHSGSRNLGKQVADFYQNMAIEQASGLLDYYIKRDELIEEYKASGKNKGLTKAIKNLRKEYRHTDCKYPKSLCYLTGSYRQLYLDDMRVCQDYASLNRLTMANIILEGLLGVGVSDFDHFETIHNYIDFEDNIIRKGAISAKKDELVLIPLNMRDGSILGRGKGNPEWNNSAPHGAGRLMSRSDAREKLSLADFKNGMKDVFSTSVSESTLDESPEAYKSMEDVFENTDDTIEILDIIKPIYNFKA